MNTPEEVYDFICELYNTIIDRFNDTELSRDSILRIFIALMDKILLEILEKDPYKVAYIYMTSFQQTMKKINQL